MQGDFRVGEHLVRYHLNRICGPAGEKTVELKAMEVLVHLARHPRQVLLKERLIQAVWPDVAVTDDVLTHAISELRKAFGDDARNPSVIETIPRRGYRLLAPVSNEIEIPSSQSEIPQELGDFAGNPKSPRPRIGDLRIDMEEPSGEIGDSSEQAEVEGLTTTARQKAAQKVGWPWRQRIAWLSVAVLGSAAVTLAVVWILSPPPAPPSVTRLLIHSAPGAPLTDAITNQVAISPDGRTVVYQARFEGRDRLFARRLDELDSTLLPGTEDAFHPFFSPDGRSVAFFAQGRLVRVSLDLGSPITLFEGGSSLQYSLGSWISEDAIVFSSDIGRALNRVSARGGKPEILLAGGENERYFGPHFLLGGKALLIHEWDGAHKGQIAALMLETGEKKVLLEGGSQAFYASTGHLIYCARNAGTLMAVPFDEKELKVKGEPFPVHGGIRSQRPGWTDYAISGNGTLVYVPDVGTMHNVVQFDRSGRRLGPVGSPGPYGQIALSMDDRRLVVESLETGNWDLWLLELSNGIISRLTRDPSLDLDPVWSPDGRRIVFASNRKGLRSLFQKDLSGGQEELLLALERPIVPDDWTQDGRFVIFRTVGKGVYALSMTGERKPQLLIETPYIEDELRVSPNGEWVAFNSDESQNHEVYVASFPSFAQKRRISKAGGVQPQWRRDGRELFYLAPDGVIMSVETRTEGTFEASLPRPLFGTAVRPPSPFAHEYGVTKDGQKFFVKEPVDQEGNQAMVVALNWFEELKRLVPTER